MTGIENKLVTLMLNGAWERIGYKTAGDAIVDLYAGINSQALDIDYQTDFAGNPVGDPIMIRAVDWAEWVTLPIRPWDLTIRSASLTVRVPTILVAKNFAEMPEKEHKGAPTTQTVYERDGGIDQYTGLPITRSEASVDHIIPKSKWKELGLAGSPDVWENVALTKKKINNKKGSKSNKEAGLKLIRPPKKPKKMKMRDIIRVPKHLDHNHFMKD